MTKQKCSNKYCPHGNWDRDALQFCDDCMKRDRLTETPELREKRERIDRWNKHKNHGRKNGEE